MWGRGPSTQFGAGHDRLAMRTPHLLLGRILTSPAIQRRDVPDGLRSLLVKALAKSADDRFATMARWAALNELSPSATEQARALARRASRRRNLNRLGDAAVLALAATPHRGDHRCSPRDRAMERSRSSTAASRLESARRPVQRGIIDWTFGF
jgi:hypothetical protein